MLYYFTRQRLGLWWTGTAEGTTNGVSAKTLALT